MALYSNLHIECKMTSLSPVVPNASLNFNYFTTFVTQDITDLSDLINQLATKINAVPTGGTSSAANWIANVMSRSASQMLIDVYDVTSVLHGGRMGSPVLISSKTLGATTASGAAPQEGAAVITLQAPYGSDVEFGPGTRPRARDRGRIYWGPLPGTAYTAEATTNRTLIATGVRTDLTAFVKSINVLTSSPHTVVWNLGVWSRKDGIMKSLQECWVDDNPDTQRRRGGKPVAKTILGLP